MHMARHILVAGAGLAGLAAARRLERGGATVSLFDARDRIGGRVWTVRDGFAGGQYGELGGELIDADQTAIRTLCGEFGLRLHRVLRFGFPQRYRVDAGFHFTRQGVWNALGESLDPLIEAYRRSGGQVSAPLLREASATSLGDWLRRRHAGPELHAMADTVRGFFLADPDDLSTLPLVEQLASGSPSEAEMYRVDGGADRLVHALAGTLRRPILLRHRLVAVEQRQDGVTAVVVDGQQRQQRLTGDAMVIALPATALADIEISPVLPVEQARAIRALKYGRATKVVVQTDRDAFAGKRIRAIATDGHLGAFWDGGEEQPRTGWSILTFLAGGSASDALRARFAAGPPALLSDLCWLGMTGAGVHTARAVSWEDDPFARGGYAYVDPAFDPSWRPVLARPAGRLAFAGEHTSERWQGYMNGAVESGLRAAREVGSSERGS